jgi:tetratricopeptide (TPR) repeat protein
VAREYHEAALEVEPEHLELMGNLALHYAFMGVEMERAVDLAEEAVERRPASGLYLSTLAYVYVRDGRLDEAREAIDEGLALGEEVATVRYVESLLLAQEGDAEAALDALADALETDGLIAYRAAREPLLACLHDDPDFRALVDGRMETPLSD